MHDAMHQHQDEAQRQNAGRNTRQHEKRPSYLEHMCIGGFGKRSARTFAKFNRAMVNVRLLTRRGVRL